MASLYKKNNVYYLSVKLNGKRKAKSLHTDKLSAAKKLQPLVEFELLKELHGLNKKQEQIHAHPVIHWSIILLSAQNLLFYFYWSPLYEFLIGVFKYEI